MAVSAFLSQIIESTVRSLSRGNKLTCSGGEEGHEIVEVSMGHRHDREFVPSRGTAFATVTAGHSSGVVRNDWGVKDEMYDV